LVKGLEKLFTFVVDVVEDVLTMLRRNVVPLVVMVHPLRLEGIRGKQKL